MRAVIAELRQSLRDCGVWGTACHAVLRGRWRRARKTAIEMAVQEFDLPYNVDTAGLISLDGLSIVSKDRRHGRRFESVLPHEFREMMLAAGDVAPGRTFIDLGCGKGRAVLLASEYNFKRVVGVEFAQELAEIARRNVRSYRNPRQVCRNLEVVAGDATLYSLPAEPIVLFLFNPFVGPPMQEVIENTQRSLEQHPRPFTLLYGNPTQEKLWDAVPFLKKAAKGRRTPSYVSYAIYHYDGDG
jgi:SAM-dependent methyltransferase